MSEQNKDLEKNYPGSGGAGNEINSRAVSFLVVLVVQQVWTLQQRL